MLEGNTFFGATGMPILKIARVRTRLAVWLPDPLTVAAWMVRSLIICSVNSFLVADLEVYASCWPTKVAPPGTGPSGWRYHSFPLQSTSCEGRHSKGAC